MSNQIKGRREKVPGEPEGIGEGDGVRPGAFTHAVQLIHRDVQAEEELQGVFGDGCGACVALGAAVQTQSLTDLFEHKLFGYLIAECWATSCPTSEEEEEGHKTAGVSVLSHASSMA